MKLTKLEEKNEPLLHRKTYLFSAEFEGATPKKEDLKKTIAAQLKAKEELVFVKNVEQFFGENKAKIIVRIYDSLENLKQLENFKEEKKEEAPKEQPKKEEPKQEEKKEEVKEDGKETETKEQKSE